MASLTFPSNEELETWTHPNLDYTYIRDDDYDEFMQDIPNDQLEIFELFATGLLLSHTPSVMCTLFDALTAITYH